MAAKASSQRTKATYQDRRSTLTVVGATVLALLLGALLKSSVLNRSQIIQQKGISASVPASWVVEDGAGDFIFASWDPFTPDVRYTVFLIPTQAGRSLLDVAAEQNLGLGKALQSFRVLEETPIIRRGREGYKVTYAFVNTEQTGLPIVLLAVNYYFPADNDTLVISLQADEQAYDEALLRFESFLDSVSYK